MLCTRWWYEYCSIAWGQSSPVDLAKTDTCICVHLFRRSEVQTQIYSSGDSNKVATETNTAKLNTKTAQHAVCGV